jgi:hypothetical protein
MGHTQIHDIGNGLLHEEGTVYSFFVVGTKHVHLWAVTNIFQEDTRIFAASDPVVVGTELTTDIKCALISENY